MKKFFALSIALSFITFIFCGCADNKDDLSAVPEISYLSQDTERDNEIMLLLENYMNAIMQHDHTAVTLYTTEDFIWNYNETGFLDYSREIISANIKEISSDQITLENDILIVPAEFEIEYKDSHITENGEEAPAGVYTYNCNFAIKKTDDAYLINSVTNAAMG